MPVIITSLNPRNTDIQPLAIKSWLENNYKILSVNAIQELNYLPVINGVVIYPTDKTAFELTGKIVPNLFPIIKLAQKQDGVVIIMNSDIYLKQDSVFHKIISGIKPGEFWFGRRTDVDSLIIFNNKWNDIYGWDWFAFHSDDANKLSEGSITFYIGEPCWDIWLPIRAIWSGLRMFNVERENCYHYRHDRAWSVAKYNMYASALKWWLMDQGDIANYTPYEDPQGLIDWTRNYIYENSYRITG